MKLGASAAWLGGSTLASQVLLLGSLPLIARLFGPEQFGIYTLFVGALAVAGVFVGLRYESAAVVAGTDREAVVLVAVVLLSGVAMALLTLFVAGVLQVAWPERAAQLGVTGLGSALALALLATAVQRAVVAWGTRRGWFRLLGLNQLGFNVLMIGAQLAGALLIAASARVLAWGHAIALALSSTIAFAAAFAGESGLLRRGFARRRLAVLSVRFRRFPTYMILYGLMTTVRERASQFMLGGVAGADVLGRFAMAWRVTSAPNSLLYSAIGPAYFSAAARGTREGNERIALQLLRLSAALLVPAFVFLAVEATPLVTWLFGQHWAGSGRMIALLSVPMLTLAATGWVDRLFDVYLQQPAALALEAGFTCVVLVVFGLALRADASGDGAILAFAALSAIYYHLYVWVAFRRSGMATSGIARLALLTWLGAAAWAVLAFWCAARLPFAGRVLVWLAVQGAVLGAWLVNTGGWRGLRDSLREWK
jgi:O-antigen/teichoic acid export membrane protein